MHGKCDVRNAGHVGREFHDERLLVCFANSLHYAGCALGCCAEGHSSVFHIGARDIEFYCWNAIEFINSPCTFGIILGAIARYIDNHIGFDVLYLRIDMLAEVINTFVLQAYTVEHTLCRLRHSGIGIALAGLQGGALDDNTSQLTQVYEVLIFYSVAKGTAGCQHGVDKVQACYVYSQICHLNFPFFFVFPK